MKEIEFKQFLIENFGEYNVNRLYKNGELNKGKSSDLYEGDYSENRNQILKIADKKFHSIVENNNWVFDFPGWVGKLDFSNDCVKEIMVIGMEPHIGFPRTIQATYGLRETNENEFSELDEYKPNSLLWKNLNSIFGKSADYRSRNFLESIYITDLCHFAISGNANEVLKIKEWNSIRYQNASKYILRTIQLIKPKFIVSQGNIVSNFVDEILGGDLFTLTNEDLPSHFEEDKNPRFKNFPHFRHYHSINNENVIHLKFPHLASGLTAGFWLHNEKYKDKRDAKINEIKQKLNL